MDAFADDHVVNDDIFEKLIDRSQVEQLEQNKLVRSEINPKSQVDINTMQTLKIKSTMLQDDKTDQNGMLASVFKKLINTVGDLTLGNDLAPGIQLAEN